MQLPGIVVTPWSQRQYDHEVVINKTNIINSQKVFLYQVPTLFLFEEHLYTQENLLFLFQAN